MKLAGKAYGELRCLMTHRLSFEDLSRIEIGDRKEEYQVLANLMYLHSHQGRNHSMKNPAV